MSTLKVENVQNLAGNAFGRVFIISGPLVPVQSGLLSFTHGLGSAPTIAGAYYEAIVANNGYSVGDRIYVQSSDGDNARQHTLWTSSTEVGYSSSTFPAVRNKAGTANFNFDATNWRIYLYAGY